MKKLLLASAVAALSVTAAQAAPTVYGKAFLSADYQDVDGSNNKRVELNSNGSRIGVKGAEALTANTDLVYQLEYGVKIDDNTADFTARDTFMGLSNKQYGTLLAGRLTAIDDMVNYADVTAGSVLGESGVLAGFDAPRANNAFAYVSPNYSGLNFLAMYALEEEVSERDAFGVGVQYAPAANPALKAGATYIQSGDFNATRVSGSYQVTPVAKVGALYQLTKFDKDSKKENALTVSGEFKTATPWTGYAQVDLVDNASGVKDAEEQRIVGGGKYGFNANTTGHVYAAYGKVKSGGAKSDGMGIGAGLEYKF